MYRTVLVWGKENLLSAPYEKPGPHGTIVVLSCTKMETEGS